MGECGELIVECMVVTSIHGSRTTSGYRLELAFLVQFFKLKRVKLLGKGAKAATQRKVIRDFRAKGSNFLLRIFSVLSPT